MGARTLKLKFRIIFFILTCLTILTADLTLVIMNKYILSYKGRIGHHYITLVGMTSVLVIFYMLVSRFSKVSEFFVNKFVHITRVYLGRVIGLYLAIGILAVLLFSGYYWAWFDRNFFNEVRLSLVKLLP
ncbi:MAG TPA: hypothetical protein PK514_13505 [Spirochaetota bacterium]|nr:hypothetical protein [Spirochaetota bacterium]